MSKPRNLGPQILSLHSEGKNYTEIMTLLGCSKGTLSYYLGDGQKRKTYVRQIKNRTLAHPYVRKLENFLGTTPYGKRRPPIHKTRKLIQAKIETFFKDRGNNMAYQKPEFTVQDVIAKFGNEPKCYLTGMPIDINQPRTYHFDHIIPVAKGGKNTLDNLQICTKQANMAKSDLTVDEFLLLCKTVLDYDKQKAMETRIERVVPSQG